MRGRHGDVARQVLACHVEGGGGTRSVERQAVGGCGELSEGRGVGAGVVEGEVGDVGIVGSEAYLRFHGAVHAHQLHVVDLQGRYGCTPLGALEVEHHADLPGVGQR